MAQNGIHGLVGLAVARKTAPSAPAGLAKPFATGIMLGAMLPDVDLYPAGAAVLLGRKDLTYRLHRGPTHSVWTLPMLAAAGTLAREERQGRAWACWGMALGAGTHIAIDAFFWFAPLDLFWPLSRWPSRDPLLPVLDLWSGVQLPPVLGNKDFVHNLVTAGEFAAIALYLRALRRVAGHTDSRADAISSVEAGLQRWERWSWRALGPALLGAAVLRASTLRTVVMTSLLLALLPYSWTQTIRLADRIARWCLRSEREAER